MTILRSVAVAAALAITGGAASASTCSVENVTYTLTQGVPDLATSGGCFSGNDKGDNGLSGIQVFDL